MKKKANHPKSIENRRARFDYEIKDIFMAGLVLNGAETKSLRLHHAHLNGAYVTLKNNEVWLINAGIMPLKTNAEFLDETIQLRDRKLLLKRKEIKELADAKQQGLTIVPLKILTGKHFIKIEIATARGKRKYDKRAALKKRDDIRSIQRADILHL